MDIKGTEDKLNQVDSLLSTLTKVVKKHWIILLIILFGLFIYWAFNLPDDNNNSDNTEQIDNSQNTDTQNIDDN